MASARRVIVVTGPPCAGKSTYIADHASRGDIVIDNDAVAAAMCMPPDWADDPALSAALVNARDMIVDALSRTPGATVWVHAMMRPDVAERKYPGAEFVHLDPGMDVCLGRAAVRLPIVRDLIAGWYR